MKLVRISILASIYVSGEPNSTEDGFEDGDEVVETDHCWMFEGQPDSVRAENGCEPQEGMRNFLYSGRFIMEDYICRARDAADWCGGPLGEGYKKNRREFSNLLKIFIKEKPEK